MILDVPKAAERLGIPPRRLKDWRCRGVGPAHIRLSHKTVVYDSEVLDEFLRSHTCQPSVQAYMEERHGSLQEKR
jgi:hypothetical protein